MLCISNHITDPYFNIASEEFLLRNFSDDIFMLYINEPSIIIGKHQNAFAEINHRFVADNNIKVIRRLSGGGTVFHDAGNLNFCFIRNGKDGNLIDFKRFTQPILEVLHKLGVPAERSGRNDLIINGLKFSGNAEHVYKNRTLHHGTLLFTSGLDNLRAALKVNANQYEDKAVKSVRSSVTNISEHLSSKINVQEFAEIITNHVINKESDVTSYKFSDSDTSSINELVTNKYSTWDWNFGYSPKFIYRNQGTIGSNQIEIELLIEKGIIISADIKINNKVNHSLIQAITNIRYRADEIKARTQSSNNGDLINITSLLF